MTDKPLFTIELHGCAVTLRCADPYAAIELYDHLMATARRAGVVKLVERADVDLGEEGRP